MLANPTMMALLPLVALTVGALAGYLAGRAGGLRGAIWLWGLMGLVGLALMVRLAVVQPDDPAAAGDPGLGALMALTGGLLPALLGAVMAGLAGRAQGRRR